MQSAADNQFPLPALTICHLSIATGYTGLPTTPSNQPDRPILKSAKVEKHANVKKWLAKHPQFHLHFIPTSSSWLNMVERWFRVLTDKAIRRGVFHSVNDLVTAIEDYLKANGCSASEGRLKALVTGG